MDERVCSFQVLERKDYSGEGSTWCLLTKSYHPRSVNVMACHYIPCVPEECTLYQIKKDIEEIKAHLAKRG